MEKESESEQVKERGEGDIERVIKVEGRKSRVARSKKIKKAKFGHKQFQKRPNKAQISLKKIC